MSATACDLSRALERLHLRIDYAMRTVCSDMKRTKRFRHGAIRLIHRLRAIPADAVKRFAVTDDLRRKWMQKGLDEREHVKRLLARNEGLCAALRKKDTEIKDLRRRMGPPIHIMEFGRRSGKTLMQEKELERLRKEGEMADGMQYTKEQARILLAGVEKSIDEKWVQLASGEHEWSEEPGCALCDACKDVAGSERKKCSVCVLVVDGVGCNDIGHPWKKWYTGSHPSGLVWNEYVKTPDIRDAASVVLDLLREKRDELRAFLAAQPDGERRVRAMSTELLEANLPAVVIARSQWHAMAEGLLEKKPDCPMCEQRGDRICVAEDSPCALHMFVGSRIFPCGQVYDKWKMIYFPAVRSALRRFPHVKARSVTLKSVPARAAAREMAELLDRLHGMIANELGKRAWKVDELVDKMHGFKVGEKVRHKYKGDGVVDGPFKDPGACNEPYINVRYDDITFLRPVPSAVKYLSRVEEPKEWHGFKLSERVRHKLWGEGIVQGGNPVRVMMLRDSDSELVWLLPAGLARVTDPDHRCGTCVYWPKNGPPEGWAGELRPCDSRLTRDEIFLMTPAGRAGLCGTDCDGWKARSCDSCGVLCGTPGERTEGCWKPKPRPERLCSECADLGVCDGDSTPEDGCWCAEPEPWPGWNAQASEENGTCPLCRDGINKHLADVKAIHAEFKDGAIYVRSSRAPDADLAVWSEGRFAVDVSIRMQSLADLINELAARAGLQGKVGG